MTEPATFGAGLLARAREHGMTSEDLANLLGFSIAHVRALPGPAALNNHPAVVLRTLAERLDLPWPGWLTTENSWPDPPAGDERTDPAQVHAVLAAAFGQSLHLGEIADVLGWDTDRVRRAVDLLATRARLTITGDTLTLTLTPGMLDHPARRRLNQLLHAHGLGPDPHVLHLIHQLSNPYARSRIAVDSAPDLITEALDGVPARRLRDRPGNRRHRAGPAPRRQVQPGPHPVSNAIQTSLKLSRTFSTLPGDIGDPALVSEPRSRERRMARVAGVDVGRSAWTRRVVRAPTAAITSTASGGIMSRCGRATSSSRPR